MRTLSIRPAGLWTDPNPHSEVPDGALRTAENVVHRRKGVLEPRPGFADDIDGGWTPPTGTVRFAIPFDGDVLLFSLNGATWTAKWLSDGDTVTPDTGSIGGKYIAHATARQSLYLSGTEGVAKIENAGVAAASVAGVIRGLQGLTSLSTDGTAWLAAGDTVAYRVLYRRTDAHDYDVRGAPSGRMTILGTTAARSVSLRLPLPSAAGIEAGDVIEIYRSVATSASKPSDDLYLAREYVITSGDLATGYVDIVDDVDEGALGRALYTNVTQEGVEQANDRPPQCEAMAAYRGSVFYGDTLSRLARVFTCAMPDAEWGVLPGTFDADFSDTDATVVNIDSSEGITAGLVGRGGGISLGQYIVEDGQTPGGAGTYIPANAKVGTINSGDSIEMTQPATGTSTDVDCHFVDVFTLDTTDFVAWSSTDPTNDPPIFTASDARRTAENLCYVINYQGDYVASVLSYGEHEFTILVEALFYSADATCEISNAWAWTPGGVAYSTNGETSLRQDDKPNRLMWSKADLPEAVPTANFLDLGDEDAAILRLLPTRDALWVVKEDGVWRLTGAGADAGWRADPRGPSIRLLEQKAAVVFEDHAWLWTDAGVIALSDVNEEKVSQPSIGESLRSIEQAVAAAGGSEGAWMAASEAEGELYLGVPAAASDEYASTVYVFSTRTLSWTTWDLEAWFMVHDPAEYNLVLLERDGTDYVVKRSGGEESFTSVVEWQARSEKDPATPKIWARGSFELLTAEGADQIDASFTSDISTTPASATVSSGAPPTGVAGHVPFWPPRAHAWSAVLFPKMTITNSTTPAWELIGIDLHYEPIGAGGARREAP